MARRTRLSIKFIFTLSFLFTDVWFPTWWNRTYSCLYLQQIVVCHYYYYYIIISIIITIVIIIIITIIVIIIIIIIIIIIVVVVTIIMIAMVFKFKFWAVVLYESLYSYFILSEEAEAFTKSYFIGTLNLGSWKSFFKIFIAQKVSNMHLVTKDFKIVPLTNLLKWKASEVASTLVLPRFQFSKICFISFLLRTGATYTGLYLLPIPLSSSIHSLLLMKYSEEDLTFICLSYQFCIWT